MAPLEAKISELERRVGGLEASHDLLIEVATRLEAVREDIGEIRAEQRAMNKALDGDREEHAKQRQQDEREAKASVRWTVGMIVASTSCIIAAVALIVGHV